MRGSGLLAAILVLLAAGACSDGRDSGQTETAASFQKELQLRLINAEAGEIISIPAGVHEINRSLSLNVSGVSIRGEGMDKTVLSFRNQVQGAEGLLVNASDFTIEDLAIEDTAGDGLKINEGKNVVIRRVLIGPEGLDLPITVAKKNAYDR